MAAVGNRRKRRRYILDSDIYVSPAAEGAQPMHSRTLDICATGIGAVFHADWQIGAVVLLRFIAPPRSGMLRAHAVVRSRNGTRYGFEVFEISNATAEVIQSACRFLSTQS